MWINATDSAACDRAIGCQLGQQEGCGLSSWD
jgi:hypothetical protein